MQPKPPATPDASLARRAKNLHGLVTAAEIDAVGLTRSQIRRRIDRGGERAEPRIYRLPGGAETWLAQAHGAVLSCDGVASHGAAARLLGLDGYASAELEVSVDGHRRLAERTYVVHRRRDYPMLTVDRHHGIRCVGAADTWLDLASRLRPTELEDLLDEIMRQRLASKRAIERTVDRRGASRKGIRTARMVLEARAPGESAALSSWSRKVQRLIVEAGLPRPVAEYRVLDQRGRLIAQVDLAYPEHRLAIELQSKHWHLSASALEADTARFRRLQVAGWMVFPVTWLQTMSEPGPFLAQIANQLE